MRVYHGISYSISGDEYTVELWNGSTAASPDTSIQLVLSGVSIDYQGQNETLYESQLKPSSCTATFTCYTASTNAADDSVKSNLIAISTDEEQKWAMKVLKNGSLFWAGRVLADQMQYLWSDRYGWMVDIKAVDMLSLVGNYKVDSSWFTLESNTRQTAIILIAEILNNTGLLDYFGTNVFGDGILTTNSDFPAARTLAYTSLPLASFIDNFSAELKSTEIKYVDGKKALSEILKTFAPVRMVLSNGVYMITQPNSYTSSTISIDYYDKNGAYNSTSNLTHAVNISTSTRPRLSNNSQTYQPPIRYAEIQWNRQNVKITERTTGASTVLTATHSGLQTGTLPGRVVKVNFNCEFYYTGALQTRYRLQTHVSAKSGSTYYYWNGSSWISNGSVPLYGYTDFFQMEYVAGKQYYSLSFEVPEPPSGYTLECGMALQKHTGTIVFTRAGSYVSWTTPTTNYEDFTGNINISQAYTSTDPREYFSRANNRINVNSPRNNTSTFVEYPINYYEGGIYDVGGVIVWNGSAYAQSTNWSSPYHSETTLASIIAGSIVGIYTNFVETLTGEFHDNGDYHPAMSYYFDSGTWIFNGGKFDVDNDIWNIEVIKVDVDYSLYTGDGEGQRVQQTSKDTLETKIKVLEEQMAKMHAVIGNYANGYLPAEIINYSGNAPTTDPGADKRYTLQLSYDYAAQILGFDVAETGESQWISIVKTSDESIISDSSFADDGQLLFPVLENSTYSFRGHVAFETDTAADFKFEFGGVAAAASVEISGIDGNGNHFLSTAFNALHTIPVIDTGTYHVTFNGVVTTGATAGNISFRWAQNASDATSTTVKKGSYIEYMKMPVAEVVEYVLLETGDFLLLETGDKIILD